MALYNSLHMHFYNLFLHTDSKYTHHKPSNEVVTFIYMKEFFLPVYLSLLGLGIDDKSLGRYPKT